MRFLRSSILRWFASSLFRFVSTLISCRTYALTSIDVCLCVVKWWETFRENNTISRLNNALIWSFVGEISLSTFYSFSIQFMFAFNSFLSVNNMHKLEIHTSATSHWFNAIIFIFCVLFRKFTRVQFIIRFILVHLWPLLPLYSEEKQEKSQCSMSSAVSNVFLCPLKW